jgi:Tfp pilus assembly protein PilN
MKSLLAKFSMRKFVGLYLGEHEVAVSEIAVTPLGPVEILSRVEPCPQNELLNVIERVLQSLHGRKRRRLQVAIGLPNSRVFFGSRPLRSGADASPEGVMQKVLCSPNVTTDDLTIDMVKGNINKSPVATVTACRKKYMAAVLAVLQRCGAQACRTEPAPCALVRAAAKQYRPPRRAKTVLRIFLGAAEGVAILTLDDLPLAWRSFAIPSFSEGMAILSAARTLMSQSRYYEIEMPLEYAMVHGRADLHERLQKEGLPSEIGTRMIWHEGPALTPQSMAYGLALGCADQTQAGFDLSRLMKPRASLRDIFPWGELACEFVLVVLMGLCLLHQNEQMRAACTAIQMRCDGNKLLASSDVGKLEIEKRNLTQKLESLHQFLDSRVIWTNYLHNLMRQSPPSIQLTSLSGGSVLQIPGPGARLLQFGASVKLLPRGAVPPAVFQFIASLRNDRLMKQNFGKIDLGTISQAGMTRSGEIKANFSVTCQSVR